MHLSEFPRAGSEGSQFAGFMVRVVKNPPAIQDLRALGSIPGLGRSPGGGHGNPLQDSCQENLMDRGAWQATVYRIAELDMTEVT